MKGLALFVLGFAVCSTLVYECGSRLARGPRIPSPKIEPAYVPSSRFLAFASLGYRNVMADLLWFQATNYFGKQFRRSRSYPWLARMCDIITDLDPRAAHVYRFAGAILPWEAKQPEEGVRLLVKGANALPGDWILPFYAGFTYYYFLDDIPQAADMMRRAAARPNAPPIAHRMLTRLLHRQRATESAVLFLEELLRTTKDETVRRSIEEHLLEARFTQAIETLQEAAEEYRRTYGLAPHTVDDLVRAGTLRSPPVDPFGGTFYFDPASGQVHSTSGHEPIRLRESELRKKIKQGRAQ